MRAMNSFILERLSSPEIEPVTLTEAKRHIRQFVSVTTEDDLVTELIKVAREWVEDYTGRALVDQTWRLTINQGPAALALPGDVVGGYARPGYYCGALNWSAMQSGFLLRRSPVLEVLSMVTFDSQGVETVVDPTTYQLREAQSKFPRIVPLAGAAWTLASFKVEFRAGFAERTGSPVTGAEVVPSTIKHAIKLILANYDQNREPVNIGNIVNELPLGIKWLLASQKCDLGMS